MNAHRLCRDRFPGVLALWMWLGAALHAQTPPARFEFKSGDVIAFTGGANLERTRFNGHLQSLLLAARPELGLRFRNLAWEGDTVFEQWRDDPGVKERWRRPRDWREILTNVGATVVFAQFGQMESLDGPARIEEFIRAYDRLLDEFVAPGRRLVLLSPMPFEKPASPTLPDLSARNHEVRQYAEAIRALAARRHLTFLDLFTPLSRAANRAGALTDNGYHLNDRGHEMIASEAARQLGLPPAPETSFPGLRAAVIEFERLWFDNWRPMNWAFLEGDRVHVPFSRDWRDPNVRLFPEEMKEFAGILREAEDNIARALRGEPVQPIAPRSPIPVEPPQTPPQTPEEELASLKVHPDYRVNLFASERDGIVKPLQIRWDERGRLWVNCIPSYPQVKPGEKANDRIVICEDTDGDGRADKFTVFADGLFMPTGFELGDGGVYVAQGTELWHLRDTDADGRADQRRIVLGGYGTGDSHQMINSLSWGFGGELWFTQGHHIESRVETPFGVERLNRSGVWRLRPRTLRMDAFFQMSSAGANCWGVMTDDYGQVFHKTGADNGGFYSVPGLIRTDLALPSEVLRLFQARVKTVGFDFVNTRHFADDLQGTVVVGGFYDNTLQLHRLTYTNAEFSTRVLPHLIETTNKVFRPIDIRLGPDGGIYFTDWYNPIIGHYQASYRHPDRDRTHGRIWRVTRKDQPLVKPALLAGASIEALFGQLDSPERWARYQAKRLLFESDTRQLTAALDRWIKSLKPGDVRDEHLRLQALSLFEAHETPRPDLLKSLLRSPDFRVRAYATRVIGNWSRAGALSDALKLLERQVADEHPRVRLEAVVAASYLADPAAIAVATRVLDQPMDKYLDYALTKCVHALRPRWEEPLLAGRLAFGRDEHLLFVLKNARLENAAALIRQQLDRQKGDPAKSRSWLAALAAVGDSADLRLVLDRGLWEAAVLDALAAEATARKAVPNGDTAADLTKLLDGADEALRERAIRLAGLWKVSALAGRIETVATDETASALIRAAALKALAALRGKEAVPLLTRLAGEGTNSPVAPAALDALAQVSLPAAAKVVVKRLGAAGNAAEAGRWLRPLLQRTGSYGPLIAALAGDGALPAPQARHTLAALNAAGRYNESLVKRLSQLAGFSADLPGFTPDYIQGVVSRARTSGNAAEGEKIYQMLGCAACHAINNTGGKIGPDLSALGRGLPIDMIVTEVIWPGLNVKEGFEAATLTTRDGRVLEGMKQSETADEIAVRDTLTGEVTRVPRSNVASVRVGGTVMPEGLTAPLTPQQLADLIRYLAELGR
jgi:putative heme-binding domain-containing protein